MIAIFIYNNKCMHIFVDARYCKKTAILRRYFKYKNVNFYYLLQYMNQIDTF